MYIYTIVLIVYDRSEFQDGSIINLYVPELSHRSTAIIFLACKIENSFFILL